MEKLKVALVMSTLVFLFGRKVKFRARRVVVEKL